MFDNYYVQQYILSIKNDGQVYHHVVNHSSMGYCLTPGRFFPNIPDLVAHYSADSYGEGNYFVKLKFEMPKTLLYVKKLFPPNFFVLASVY